MRIADKGRFFTYCWDTESYPFGCAMESRQRQAQRELFFELLKMIYHEWMLKGVAYGDVAAAMSKTAATLYNDDPMHKASSMQELYNMRLKRGMPFEQGVEALWDKVEDLEAINARYSALWKATTSRSARRSCSTASSMATLTLRRC
jgi:hypothetical protein